MMHAKKLRKSLRIKESSACDKCPVAKDCHLRDKEAKKPVCSVSDLLLYMYWMVRVSPGYDQDSLNMEEFEKYLAAQRVLDALEPLLLIHKQTEVTERAAKKTSEMNMSYESFINDQENQNQKLTLHRLVTINGDDFEQINKVSGVLKLMGERIRNSKNKNGRGLRKANKLTKQNKEWMDSPETRKIEKLDLGDLMRTRQD